MANYQNNQNRKAIRVLATPSACQVAIYSQLDINHDEIKPPKPGFNYGLAFMWPVQLTATGTTSSRFHFYWLIAYLLMNPIYIALVPPNQLQRTPKKSEIHSASFPMYKAFYTRQRIQIVWIVILPESAKVC